MLGVKFGIYLSSRVLVATGKPKFAMASGQAAKRSDPAPKSQPSINFFGKKKTIKKREKENKKSNERMK